MMDMWFWAFCIVVFVLWAQASDIRMVISLWIKSRASLKLEEQRTRQIEAMSKMSSADQQRLLDTMPAWLDKSDPEEVQAWQKARAEVVAGLMEMHVLQPWAKGHQQEWERHRIGSERAIVQVRRTGSNLTWEVWHTGLAGMTRMEQGTYYEDIQEAQRVADKWAVSRGWVLSEPLNG
jgi:hypothetical protein